MFRVLGIHTLIYSQTYLQLASLQSLHLKKTKRTKKARVTDEIYLEFIQY